MRRAQLALAVAVAAPCAAQDQLWIEQFGTAGHDSVTAAAADATGGVYFAGYTSGALGGAHFGAGDAWLERRSADGGRIWIRQIGTFYGDGAHAVAGDGAAGVFITGETAGDLGAPRAGEADVWVARYDESGGQRWLRQIGTPAYDTARAAAPDGSNGAFIGGYTRGALGGPSLGDADAWLARYDGAGERLWIVQLGSSAWDAVVAAAPDHAGGVYVTGSTLGQLGGASFGSADVWLARYDTLGERLWIRQFGTSDNEGASFATPDDAGGAYIGGYAESIVGETAWLARYDADGNRLWIRQFGDSIGGDMYAKGAEDGAGGVFVVGATDGVVGGPHVGGNDVWLSRFDGAGAQLWVDQFGSTADETVRAAASDGAGGLMIGGYTLGDLAAPSAGEIDIWVARYGDDDCYPDCDGNGELDFFDFLCFQNAFATGDRYADCDGTGALDFFDFLCFQNAFAVGCPQ
ncbi:MAG: hypothetical protein ACF8R7_15855 [Phycisphaerales bacterium JB039]